MLNDKEVYKLFNENKKLVGFCFKKYLNMYNHYDYEDIIQEGYVELFRCCKRFDVDKGVAFSTYAVPSIIGAMKRYLRERASVIRVPRKIHDSGDSEEINKIINYASFDFEMDNGKNDGGSNLHEIIPGLPDDYDFEIEDLVIEFLDSINDKIHKDIMEDYYYAIMYGDKLSQHYLCNKYNKSQPVISRIIKKYNELLKLKIKEVL